jgi:hypothetical protein
MDPRLRGDDRRGAGEDAGAGLFSKKELGMSGGASKFQEKLLAPGMARFERRLTSLVLFY